MPRGEASRSMDLGGPYPTISISAKKKAISRAALSAESEPCTIAKTGVLAYSGQRPENQASGRRGNSSAPVGVHPLIEGAEFNDGQQTAE